MTADAEVPGREYDSFVCDTIASDIFICVRPKQNLDETNTMEYFWALETGKVVEYFRYESQREFLPACQIAGHARQ